MKILGIILLLLYIPLFSEENESYKKASVLYKDKAYKESIEILEKSIAEGNTGYEMYLLLSYNYWATSRQEESIEQLQKALKQNNEEPEVHIDLIRAYVSMQKYKVAQSFCEKALQKFPENKLLKLQNAILLGKLGKPVAATKIIEELKVSSPNDPRPLGIEAHLYALRGELEKAEISLKWGLSLDPVNPFFKNNLAILYEKMADRELKNNKKDSAKKFLEDATQAINEAVGTNPKEIFISNQTRIKEKLSKIE
jgi:tetratricopeptide (TPR) repeat protein